MSPLAYPQADTDAVQARRMFRWRGGAVRLVTPPDDLRFRYPSGEAEQDPHVIPFGWGVKRDVDEQPWVWRYGQADAGTGSRYAATVTRLHGDVARYEGGEALVTVLSPWQDAHALSLHAGWLDESYVAEHLTAGRLREGRLHAGDLAALTLLLRRLLGPRGRLMPMIHMAETRQALDGSYGWICRCGETETGYRTRNRARNAGDAHLTAANGDR